MRILHFYRYHTTKIKITGADHALEHEQLLRLVSEYSQLTAEELIKKAVDKIMLSEDTLVIETTLNSYKITAPFQMDSGSTSSVVIRPASTGMPEDIFSLPTHRLKNLMKGIIWRDEHFHGTSIAAIARREGSTDVLVGRLIRESLEIA